MKEFKSNCVHNRKLYDSLFKGYKQTKKPHILRIISTIYIIFLISLCIFAKLYNLIIKIDIFLIIYILFLWFLEKRNSKLQYNRSVLANGGMEAICDINIGDKNIIARNNNIESIQTFNYDTVLEIVEVNSYLFLLLKHKLFLPIDISSFDDESKKELINFLYKKCNNLKLKRVSSYKNYGKWIIVGIAFVTLIFSIINL